MQAVSFAPKLPGVVAAWVGAGGAAAWAVLAVDPASRVLAAAATALLGVLALLGSALRPRLAADADGIRLGRLRGTRHWPWAAVHRIEVVTSRRLGREVGMLELDLDDGGHERLVVLTTLDLGADPRDVEDALHGLDVSRGS